MYLINLKKLKPDQIPLLTLQLLFVFLTDASQSKEITFPPSKEPAFVTVPGKGFADPFSITPGTWITCIQVEGVLLVS